LGTVSVGINFFDDIVFVSPMGLEAIEISSDRASLKHRSTMVDRKLINESDLANCKAELWNNYLVLLVGGRIYLADARQVYRGNRNVEYEWYFWENIVSLPSEGEMQYDACCIREYEGTLYIGCKNGAVCIFSGTTDFGTPIFSYWTTPMDNFGTMTYYKKWSVPGGTNQALQNSYQSGTNGQHRLENVLRTRRIIQLESKFSF
jgi:hypothetical protein